MTYFINKTEDYHKNEMETLGWELTVCNSLEHENSPVRSILDVNSSFGNLLYEYLSKHIDTSDIKKIIEIGGGYGFLMRDINKKFNNADITMVDISPFLLEQQKKTLVESTVSFINMDFFKYNDDELKTFDLAIFNENIGDFPAICNISTDILSGEMKNLDSVEERIYGFFKKYKFEIPEIPYFNLNIGAIEAVEKLCNSNVKNIFLSEHSCESIVDDEQFKYVKIDTPGNPEKIGLKGHDEYTIKFSYLERVAKFNGYSVIRGNFTDFIKINYSDRLNFILTSNSQKDEHEIIRQFIEDLFKYEYLLLQK